MRATRYAWVALLMGSQATAGAAQQAGGLALDHVFLVVSPGAPEGVALRDAGFAFIPDTTVHAGQGTASTAVVFENMYLELIWQHGDADPMRMAERADWRETGASPIGIGLRRVDTVAVDLPFATRPHRAAWMRPGTAIDIATSRDGRPSDPSVFVVPAYLSFTAAVQQRGAPPPQPTGARRLTGMRVYGPQPGGPSDAERALEAAAIAHFEASDEHRLELVFDDAAQGKELDFRPRLPLVIRY